MWKILKDFVKSSKIFDGYLLIYYSRQYWYSIIQSLAKYREMG